MMPRTPGDRPARDDAPRPPGTVRRRLAWLVAAAAAALAVGWYLGARRPRVGDPPQIDAARAAPAVVQAIAQARAKVLQEPHSAPRRGALGMLLMAHEFFAEARQSFLQARLLEPRQFRWAYYLARLEEENDLELALALYREALDLDDHYAALHDRMARLLLRLDRPEEARQHYQRAARLEPQSPFPLLGLARLAVQQGSLSEARRLFDEAAENAPWLVETHLGRAQVLHAAGDVAGAQAALEQAALLPAAPREMPDALLADVHALELSSNRIARQADALLAQGRLAEAAEALAELARARPDQARPLLSLGQIHLARHQPGAAVAALRSACERFPEDAVAHFLLGTALLAQGATREAARNLRRAVELKPDYARAWLSLGQAESHLANPEMARSAYERVVAIEPGLLKGWLALSEVCLAQDDLQAARAALAAAQKLAPGSPEVRKLLQQVP